MLDTRKVTSVRDTILKPSQSSFPSYLRTWSLICREASTAVQLPFRGVLGSQPSPSRSSFPRP
eukprot:jgi/Botrbrau1/6518/Bobra.0034s0090.1